MEALLEIARKFAGQAEVYGRERAASTVVFADGRLHEIEGQKLSGTSLRLIEDGTLGFAYTRNLSDREELVRHAKASLVGGASAGFDLPGPADLPSLETYDPAEERTTNADRVEECARAVEILREQTGAEVMLTSFSHIDRIRVLNSAGADHEARTTLAYQYAMLIYPGSGSGLLRSHHARSHEPLPDAVIEEMVALYRAGAKPVRPMTGRMKVLFMPGCQFLLGWRLKDGLSGRSRLEGVSPVADRVGDRVLSDLITLVDAPLDTAHGAPRSFDDEGVPCRRLVTIERGVLKGFYNNLDYACRLGVEPTGHGYREVRFGGDPITLPPRPTLGHTTIVPGASSFADLVASIDRGLILESVLGAHSGNIMNGDYSVGVSHGLYVEKGEIAGRVSDAVVAGNAWETLSNVVALGDRPELGWERLGPPILCDDVSVVCA